MARARVLIRNNAICYFKPYHSTWTLRPQLFIAAIDTLAKSVYCNQKTLTTWRLITKGCLHENLTYNLQLTTYNLQLTILKKHFFFAKHKLSSKKHLGPGLPGAAHVQLGAPKTGPVFRYKHKEESPRMSTNFSKTNAIAPVARSNLRCFCWCAPSSSPDAWSVGACSGCGPRGTNMKGDSKWQSFVDFFRAQIFRYAIS